MLLQDIWCHIHSLMPMQDSARSACVSHAFLDSWRHHPNLILNKETLGRNACGKGDIARTLISKVDQILKKHSRTAMKILKLDIFDCHDVDISDLNNWLQIAIIPGIEKLVLSLPSGYQEVYTFPCSLLFGQNGSSLRYLQLSYCTFRPTVGFGFLRSLTKLYLRNVRTTGGELGCLLSNSLALQLLELRYCSEIIYLKIPCVLERLSCLNVSACNALQIVESNAPNLSTFNFNGDTVQLSLRQSLQVKNLYMGCPNVSNLLCYAITKLPYVVSTVEDLKLSSPSGERVNTPMAAAKFLHLKFLEIYLDGDLSPGYDYLSLVSFLDASPALETFIFRVDQDEMLFDSIIGGALHMRQMPEHKHNSLKNVKILGFCSAKSMVELTCHILENATSLECITLDTIYDAEDEDFVGRCSETSARRSGKCSIQTSEMMLEANKARIAIVGYIERKVPSTVKLDVRGPCSRCHTLELISS
uniref:At1g61320/AtMIF1 LRR domain-containing protein n=2 Tax=Hordeum vulgare subsp. vulgare TaxID=112509 RepID=A0A8I6Y854_HORVV